MRGPADCFEAFVDRFHEFEALGRAIGRDLARDIDDAAWSADRAREMHHLGTLLQRTAHEGSEAFYAWQAARPAGPVR